MPSLPLLCKFNDLKSNRIANSRPGLNQMQKDQGFPRPHWVPGLGKVWTCKEIEEWFRGQGIDLAENEHQPAKSDLRNSNRIPEGLTSISSTTPMAPPVPSQVAPDFARAKCRPARVKTNGVRE